MDTRNTLMNPFAPPLKDGHFHPRIMGDPRGININTRGFDSNYNQVGILTRLSGDETILPGWVVHYIVISYGSIIHE